jgi:hypothetical protein
VAWDYSKFGMENVLGLIGMVIFIVGVISLAAGVTYAIVRISPSKRREKGSAPKPAA